MNGYKQFYTYFFFLNSHVEFIRRQVKVVDHALVWVATSQASSHVFIDVLSCTTQLIYNETL